MPIVPKTTREEVIIVGRTETNNYGDLIVTDINENTHKVSYKRSHLHGLFEPDKAVNLKYAVFQNHEYIHDAELPEDRLPETEQPKPQAEQVPVERVRTDGFKKEPVNVKNRAVTTNYSILAINAGWWPAGSMANFAHKMELYFEDKITADQLDQYIQQVLHSVG